MRQSKAANIALGLVLITLALAALGLMIGSEARVQRLAVNTLWLVGLVGLVAVPSGSLLAFLCFRTDLPGSRALALTLGLALFVPLYLHAAAWQSGFGWDGWYTVLSGNVYRPPATTDWSNLATGPPISTGALVEGWRGAVLVHAAYAIPWVVLIVGLGLRQVEGELEEYALLETSLWRAFCHVTLRRAAPSIVVATLWVAISTAAEMTVTDLFQVRTYAEELYTDLTLGVPAGVSAVRALPGIAATVWLVAAGCLVVASMTPRGLAGSVASRVTFPLGRMRWLVAAMGGLATTAVIGVPLFSLVYKAGSTVTVVSGTRVRGWSFTKLFSLVAEAPHRFEREFGWTFALAALTATFAVAIGLAVAWPARKGGWRGAVALFLSGIGVAIPGPLLGLAIIELLNRPDADWLVTLYDRTLLAPCLALLVRTTPWATLILWYALRSVPNDTLEVAELEGAGAWTRFWRIALPQRYPAVALAWLVAAVIAMGDLSATILVLPPGVTTLSNRIFERLHYGAEDQVAGLCLVLVAGIAALGLLARWLAGRLETMSGS